jgi:signal peptidase I
MKFLDRRTSRLPAPWRTIVDWAATIAVALTVVLVLEAEVAKPYRIPSASMEPTLHCARPADGCRAQFSDRVIANRLAYRFGGPKRGQVVVFHVPARAEQACGTEGGSTFVKRLIGLPGEVVSERAGRVYVDGRRLDEPYVPPGRRDDATRTWPRVPPSSYFMMGDNRNDSCDSRAWGPVPRGNLIGPVLAVYWPPDRLSLR